MVQVNFNTSNKFQSLRPQQRLSNTSVTSEAENPMRNATWVWRLGALRVVSSFWPPFGGKEDMRILLMCPLETSNDDTH